MECEEISWVTAFEHSTSKLKNLYADLRGTPELLKWLSRVLIELETNTFDEIETSDSRIPSTRGLIILDNLINYSLEIIKEKINIKYKNDLLDYLNKTMFYDFKNFMNIVSEILKQYINVTVSIFTNFNLLKPYVNLLELIFLNREIYKEIQCYPGLKRLPFQSLVLAKYLHEQELRSFLERRLENMPVEIIYEHFKHARRILTETIEYLRTLNRVVIARSMDEAKEILDSLKFPPSSPEQVRPWIAKHCSREASGKLCCDLLALMYHCLCVEEHIEVGAGVGNQRISAENFGDLVKQNQHVAFAICCSLLDCGFIPLTNVKISELEGEVDIVALGRAILTGSAPLNALVEVSWSGSEKGEHVEEAKRRIQGDKSHILDFLFSHEGIKFRGAIFARRLSESDKVTVCRSESGVSYVIADAAMLMKPEYAIAATLSLC